MSLPEVLKQKAAFTRQETAELLSVSEGVIRLWESEGRLHSLRFGRLRRIPASEIERLLQYGLVEKQEA
jgi:excisionase family DNA binding protein